MSETNDTLKQLLGMVAGSLSTCSALTSLLTSRGVISPTQLRGMLESMEKQLGLEDQHMQEGMKHFIDAVNYAAEISAPKSDNDGK